MKIVCYLKLLIDRNRVLVKLDINTENQFMLRPGEMAGNRFLTNPDNSSENQFSYKLDGAGASKYLVRLTRERKKLRPVTFFIFDRNQTQPRKFQFKIVKNVNIRINKIYLPLFLTWKLPEYLKLKTIFF